MKYRETARHYLSAAFSVLFALAGVMAIRMLRGDAAADDGTRTMFWQVARLAVRDNILEGSLIFLVLLAASLRFLKDSPRLDKSRLALSTVIAVIWACGVSFRQSGSLGWLFSSPGHATGTLAFVLGWLWILYMLATVGEKCVSKRGVSGHWLLLPKSGERKFAFYFALIILLWLPYIIISFPGFTTAGVWWSLSYTHGISEFSGHVPPLHTLLISACFSIGEALGDSNIGLFLGVLTQVIPFALILSHGFRVMQRMKAPHIAYVISWLLISLCPYYTNYMVTFLRDNPYSYGVLLFQIELIVLMEEGKGDFFSKKDYALYSAGVLMSVFFRKNGLLLILFSVAAVVLARVGKLKSRGMRTICIQIAALALPILLAVGVESSVNLAYHVKPGSRREALSLPFQQTARYFAEYGDEVEPEEFDAVARVLDADIIAQAYDPFLSDPVKDTFNDEATSSDLANYFKAWLKMFFKHPMVYVEATLHQNYLLFDLQEENPYIYAVLTAGQSEEYAELAHLHPIKAIAPTNWKLCDAWREIMEMPLIGMLSCVGFYSVFLLFLLDGAIKRRNAKWTVVAVPSLLSILIVILAPCIKNHPRYALPMIYSFPIVLSYYFACAAENAADA